ncbi:MAG: peptidylprolyl isomerase [Methanocorpusculum parvum]|nr:peptidylprolyl isomerase [Methanocorpusculum parvum]
MMKKLAAVFLLAAVILCAGCIAEERTAQPGDRVFVYYTLSLDDGTVHESNVGKTPLEFVVGAGQMISGFDAAVSGMKVGETKKIRLAPSEAYGEITEAMMQDMKISELQESLGEIPAEGEILTVTVQTDAGYQQMYAKVMKVDNEVGIVSLAFMRMPLVGEYLTFEITLDSIV